MAVSFRKCTMQKCASLPFAGSVDRMSSLSEAADPLFSGAEHEFPSVGT